MTCIVGIVQGDEVWIGGDGQAIAGEVRRHTTQPKVFRRGEMLIAGAGTSYVLQAMQHRWEPPLWLPDDDPLDYLASDVMPMLRKFLKENDLLLSGDGDVLYMDAVLLIGLKGRLFRTDAYFMVSESNDGYQAIGSGEEPALGSLFASPELLPKLRIETALRAASHFKPCVGPPFHVEKL